jgi:hypothetical protein
MRQPLPVPAYVFDAPDEMPGGYKPVVSDEAMIGISAKKPVRKPKAVKPVAEKIVPQTSVEILAEMVETAKTKREIRQISCLAYSMARTDWRYMTVSKLADQKLCTLYGVR